MIVFIINGAPRVGKDTFIKLLNDSVDPFVYSYSSIDWVKEIAKEVFGWDGVKTVKSRELLSNLKNIASAWNDQPFKKILEQYKAAERYAYGFFCTNIREPKEIQKLKKWCKQRKILCYSILIRNPKIEQKAIDEGFSSSGDTQYMNFAYDWILYNDRKLADFKAIIKSHLNTIKE